MRAFYDGDGSADLKKERRIAASEAQPIADHIYRQTAWWSGSTGDLQLDADVKFVLDPALARQRREDQSASALAWWSGWTGDLDADGNFVLDPVLSPFLYAVYINGLHKALSDVGLGVWVQGRRVPLLLYADDIVLLARTEAELQAMLDVVTVYARQ
jgi:hypothetical protein